MGEAYPAVYVKRLSKMLERHMNVPYQLHCITDRSDRLPERVFRIDASDWHEMKREGMRVTTNKIRLFDPSAIPFEEFLYLDVTLVIQKDMRPLLEYAMAQGEDLVIVKDWNYDCFNSCVMRIRRSPALEAIYRTWLEGKSFPFRNAGDQDFIHSCVHHLGLCDKVALFQPDHVVSYRNLRNRHRTDPKGAYEAIRKGIIVKFWGEPKMHQLANPYYNLMRIRLRHLTRGPKDARFWLRELRRNWR
jgi:hypothetical protein